MSTDQNYYTIGANGVSVKILPAETDSKGKVIQKTDVATIAEILNFQIKFARDSWGRLHYYHNNDYNENGDELLKELYKSVLKCWGLTSTWNTKIASSIPIYIAADSPKLLERPIQHKLKLKNSVYEFDENWEYEKGENLRDDDSYLTNIRLNIEYNSEATCHKINNFIEQVLWDGVNEETKSASRDVFYQILAYLCIPTTDLQKAFLFYGPKSSNGKSKLIDLMISFLGYKNCSNVALHDLERERFSLGAICGKLLNISGEIDSDKIKGSARFKSIVSGDPIQIEFKGKDLFSYRPFCRLVFSTNKLPKSDDTTDGWKRRWYIIHCLNSFAQNKQKENELHSLFTNEWELSGLLNEVIPWIPKVMRHGIVTPRELAHIENYSPPPDCVREFILEYLEKNASGRISSELWNRICTHFVPGIHSDSPKFEQRGVMKDYMTTVFGADIYKQAYFPEVGNSSTGYIGIMFKPGKYEELIKKCETTQGTGMIKSKLAYLLEGYLKRNGGNNIQTLGVKQPDLPLESIG